MTLSHSVHGVQSFQSAAELLQRLVALDPTEAKRIRQQMGHAQRVRRRLALGWWRRATAATTVRTLFS